MAVFLVIFVDKPDAVFKAVVNDAGGLTVPTVIDPVVWFRGCFLVLECTVVFAGVVGFVRDEVSRVDGVFGTT